METLPTLTLRRAEPTKLTEGLLSANKVIDLSKLKNAVESTEH